MEKQETDINAKTVLTAYKAVGTVCGKREKVKNV
jgi:hypothetical protein